MILGDFRLGRRTILIYHKTPSDQRRKYGAGRCLNHASRPSLRVGGGVIDRLREEQNDQNDRCCLGDCNIRHKVWRLRRFPNRTA